MAEKKRLSELSWQFGLMICLQRLAFVSVSGFFFLSGVKLTLPTAPPPLGRYWRRRVQAIFLPYLLAVAVYYMYFMRHGYFGFSLPDLIGYAVRGDLSAPFYFVVALAQFVVLVPLFRWLARRWSPVILLPVALGVTMLSGQYLNDMLHLLSPALNFAYGDRIFTTYLVYYLAGCCAGQCYQEFVELLQKNLRLLVGCALFLMAADAYCSWQLFVNGQPVPFLETLHTLYQLTAIPALYALALRFPIRLPPLAQKMDRASFLVYLYHSHHLVQRLYPPFGHYEGIPPVSSAGRLYLPGHLPAVYPVAVGLRSGQGSPGLPRWGSPIKHPSCASINKKETPMSDNKKPEQRPPESYTPASPVKRTLAWIALAYVLIGLALTTFYFFNGYMLGNLGPLLTVPGLIGLGALGLVSWRSTGRPGKFPAILLAILCWAAALATLPIGIVGLLSNFGR